MTLLSSLGIPLYCFLIRFLYAYSIIVTPSYIILRSHMTFGTLLHRPRFSVIGGDALLATLAVADDVLLCKTIELAEIYTKLHSLLINGIKIRGIGKIVLANFKADMCVVGATARVPSSVIPRQGLVGCDCAIIEFSDEAVNADLTTAGVIGVPMVAILVFAKQAVIGANVAFEPGVVCSGGMNHNAFNRNGSACLIASVLGKNKGMKIQITHSPWGYQQ